jgi:hypothetical protein
MGGFAAGRIGMGGCGTLRERKWLPAMRYISAVRVAEAWRRRPAEMRGAAAGEVGDAGATVRCGAEVELGRVETWSGRIRTVRRFCGNREGSGFVGLVMTGFHRIIGRRNKFIRGPLILQQIRFSSLNPKTRYNRSPICQNRCPWRF